MSGLGTLRIGEQLLPVMRVQLVDGGIVVTAHTHTSLDADYWQLYGSDGALVGSGSERRPAVALDPGQGADISWKLTITDRLATPGGPMTIDGVVIG